LPTRGRARVCSRRAALRRRSTQRRCAIRIGVPRESREGEKRVAATPESVAKLRETGLAIAIERGAGKDAGYADGDYVAAGATLAEDAATILAESDVVLKVRPPTEDEARQLREGAVLISLLQPERHPELPEILAGRKVSAIALERIPRITRAQKMDVLSSQANLAGYRAVVEAAAHFEGFFGPQVTAAGATRPARVLVIGAGVAGLAAVGAARALGAEVRAFDTRAAAREQVESLGAQFLEVALEESGEGGGGYAKVMSKEFIEAEMALFRAQGEGGVDVVITTALVPGTRAPTLLPRDVVEAFRPGSVIVDMAAEQGGNCELCVPGEIVVHRGVKILGFTDLASRMASTASKFFAMNLVHLLADMGAGKEGGPRIDLESDVVRPALVAHGGELLPPPPRKEPSPAAPGAKTKAGPRSTRPPPPSAQSKQKDIQNPARRAWGTTLFGTLVIAALFALGRFAPGDFLQHFTVFILACFVGWQVIWSVSPALHTPLMSVTNAISGIIVVGGMLQIGTEIDLASVLGAIAVLVAAINVSGGFLVTQRMLRMFRKDGR
jgi:NAD(P) transhydrogenase subunit alpha